MSYSGTLWDVKGNWQPERGLRGTLAARKPFADTPREVRGRVGRLAIAANSQMITPREREEELQSVVDLLWDLALRIEEGEFAMAEKHLRSLQDALQKALAENASDEEVQKLMDELQQAMDRYVDALKDKMDREPRGPRSRPQMNSNTVEMRREDLQKMLERARDMAKAGNRDAARELLAQMQQMLESLQTQQMAGNMSEDMEKAMQMLEDMDQLMDKQQELMDQTLDRKSVV